MINCNGCLVPDLRDMFSNTSEVQREAPAMITKVVRVRRLDDAGQLREDLEYWLKKSPAERVAAVDYLRRQVHGSTARLQRVVRVIERSRG